MIIKIVVIGIIAMVGFTVGAVWLNVKETQEGKRAKFNCDKCKAYSCQAKWCKRERKILEDVRK